MKRFILLFLLFACSVEIHAQQPYRLKKKKRCFTPERICVLWGTGLEQPLFMNNRFSRELTRPGSYSIYMSAGWNLNKDNLFYFGLSGYNHYGDRDKKVLTRLLNEYGTSSFGDLNLHDVSEFRIGVGYMHFRPLSSKLYLSARFSADVLAMDHSQIIFEDINTGAFIKAHKTKFKTGASASAGLGIEYRLYEKRKYYALGLSYGLIGGFYPAEFEIWEGPNYEQFEKRLYGHNFRIFRHGIHLNLRLAV